MADPSQLGLDFEQPIYQLQLQLELREKEADLTAEGEDELRRLRRELADLTRKIYSNLTPWETVKVARHKNRPQTADYITMVFEEFVELHGDRRFGDDRALITGFAKLGKYKVLLVGHKKGRNYKERSECFFGCAHPEGYRKALAKMRMADKFGLPIICLIDTPGAYPGLGAEERGQAQAIAENLFEMSRLRTPIVCVVIGEGGSGGALGIGIGDTVAMMEHAYYSVISPEGCAGILWKSHEFAEQAANSLRFTSRDLLEFKIVDHVIEEPLGGAHRQPHQAAARLRQFLLKTLREWEPVERTTLVQRRYEKFRRMGVFLESPPAGAGSADQPTTGQNSSGPSAGNSAGNGQLGGPQPASTRPASGRGR